MSRNHEFDYSNHNAIMDLLSLGSKHELTSEGVRKIAQLTENILKSEFAIEIPTDLEITIEQNSIEITKLNYNDRTFQWTAKFSGNTNFLKSLAEMSFFKNLTKNKDETYTAVMEAKTTIVSGTHYLAGLLKSK